MPPELLLGLAGLGAGALGALLGLGGGILIVPILTLGFGVPLHAAIGTSLVCVIGTSIGGAAMNVASGAADVRLGILLGAGTIMGAATGGLAAGWLSDRVLAGLFALLLAYTVIAMLRGLRAARGTDDATVPIDASAPDGPGAPAYRGQRRGLAVGGAVGAGAVSGLLGVGGGIVTVPIIHLVMGAPMRVATATSNYIVGLTGAAGAYTYLFRGDVDMGTAAPTVLGVVAGAAVSARLGARVRSSWLIVLFCAVMGYVAVRMALRALGTG